jgi:hypothetical protein
MRNIVNDNGAIKIGHRRTVAILLLDEVLSRLGEEFFRTLS